MTKSTCRTCGKSIPGDLPGHVCGLCRVGLVPLAGRNNWDEPSVGGEERAASHPFDENSRLSGAEGRQLTGLDCPECGATLTINDLRNRECSVCDARLGRDLYRGGIPPSRSRRPSQTAKAGEHPIWPGDAPYW